MTAATVDADKYARLFSAAKTVFKMMEEGQISINIVLQNANDPNWHSKVKEYGNVVSALGAALYAIDPTLAYPE